MLSIWRAVRSTRRCSPRSIGWRRRWANRRALRYRRKGLREAIARHMNEMLAGNGVLALPTVPGIAPLRNTPPAELDDFRGRAMSLLCIAGLARLPQVSLPLATLDGCPLGLSLIAARGGDMMLLGLAKALAAA